jgi:hypothetical protein
MKILKPTSMAQELRTNINFNFRLYKLDFTCSFCMRLEIVWNECRIFSMSLSDDFENNIQTSLQTLIAIMIFGGAVCIGTCFKKFERGEFASHVTANRWNPGGSS